MAEFQSFRVNTHASNYRTNPLLAPGGYSLSATKRPMNSPRGLPEDLYGTSLTFHSCAGSVACSVVGQPNPCSLRARGGRRLPVVALPANEAHRSLHFVPFNAELRRLTCALIRFRRYAMQRSLRRDCDLAASTGRQHGLGVRRADELL